MSWATTIVSAASPVERNIWMKAAPNARVTSSLTWSGTVPRTS
jgi:hypothetical protein